MSAGLQPAARVRRRVFRTTSYFDVAGPGPETPRQTLVLLHAFPLAAAMWRPQLAAAPAGWRVIAPDLRGFGRSPVGDPSVPASMDGYARDVVALVDHLRLDRVVVGGLSMGGYVAFALLAMAPERVAGLVLADTRPEADDEAARANRDRMAETLAGGGPSAVFERMRPALLGASTRALRPDVVQTVQGMVLAQRSDAIRLAIDSLKARPDSRPLLAGIACPTLIVVGDEDQITNVDVARFMHARIPGAALAVIEKAGHLSNLEQPEAFNAVLTGFLQCCQ
jgi:pimeloyl-ACP methyl ester carboxylesterase